MSKTHNRGEESVSSITFDGSIQPLLIAPETNALGQLPPGYVIAGKYRIEKVIGHGGMGVIHAAQHLSLKERVAIKVMRPAVMVIPGMRTRFLREARAGSKVKSEHVCRVIDIDTLPSGMPYIVFEHLEGIDLAELRREVGPLPIADAVRYVVEACDAIAETHRLGIVHRDLKPSNLFLANWRNGRRIIKVLDFGISKVKSTDDPDTTSAGTALGSPHYMAPEQMQSARDIDERADIWGLGAILYGLLTGRQPFKADALEDVCRLVLLHEPPPLVSLRPEVPPELEAIVQRCLRKSPNDRYATADDLARALLPFCRPSAVKTGPVPVRREPQPDKQEGPASPPLRHEQLEPTKPDVRPSSPPTNSGMLQWSAEFRIPKRSWATNLGVVIAVCAALLVTFGRGSGERAAADRAAADRAEEAEEMSPFATRDPAEGTTEPILPQWANTHVVSSTEVAEEPVSRATGCDPKSPSNRATTRRQTRPVVPGATMKGGPRDRPATPRMPRMKEHCSAP